MGYQTASYQPSPTRERLLVKFLPSADVNPQAFFAARQLRVLNYIQLSGTWVVELKENADVLAVMSDIAGAPGIDFVEQDAVRFTFDWHGGNGASITAEDNSRPVLTPASSSPVLSATSTTLGVLFMLGLVGWVLRKL